MKTIPLIQSMVVGLVCAALVSCSDKSPNQPACSFALTPASLPFGPDGGTGAVTVTAAANCEWSASAVTGWISMPGTSGKGTGSMTYSVSPNPNTESRTGALTIAGQNHATQDRCIWTAASEVPWITVTSSMPGSSSSRRRDSDGGSRSAFVNVSGAQRRIDADGSIYGATTARRGSTAAFTASCRFRLA
jgi:hypothetical protein